MLTLQRQITVRSINEHVMFNTIVTEKQAYFQCGNWLKNSNNYPSRFCWKWKFNWPRLKVDWLCFWGVWFPHPSVEWWLGLYRATVGSQHTTWLSSRDAPPRAAAGHFPAKTGEFGREEGEGRCRWYCNKIVIWNVQIFKMILFVLQKSPRCGYGAV